MRKDLQEHINQYGVTRTHIAKQINVSRSMLTLYLQNQRNLSEENEFKLKKYLGQFEQIKLTWHSIWSEFKLTWQIVESMLQLGKWIYLCNINVFLAGDLARYLSTNRHCFTLEGNILYKRMLYRMGEMQLQGGIYNGESEKKAVPNQKL